MSNKLSILKYYLTFRYRRFHSRKELTEFQQKKIRSHLRLITEKSLFYHIYRNKELQDFPVIDKKIMMDNFDIINTVGINKDDAAAFAIDSERTRSFSPELHNITVGLSSGTSYSRGIFLVENTEKEKWAGFVLAKFLKRGIAAKYNVAFFMRANSNLYESVGSRNIHFEFFDIYADPSENLKKLNNFDADIIVAQPSLLLMIAEEINQGRLSVHPETVISIAEVLEKEDEKILRSAFGTDVIHQVYQCTEGCLAATCRYGTLHLNEDIVHIEKEYLDDKRFIPIITDFERTSQPIIRYRLNDVLVEKKNTCPCGCVYTALEKIEGREDDIFEMEGNDGQIVKIFPDFIRRCILFSGEITDYRIQQMPDGSIQIFADIDDDRKTRVREEFEKMSIDKGFRLPPIRFNAYSYDKSRKLKRVEKVTSLINYSDMCPELNP